MLNLIRKFLQPTLREQLESGVREALRRYADRHTAPDLRVYLSTDLVPEGVDQGRWARDEALHLRRFALQWAEDNNISRAGLRVEVILLDTKREFAFVKPLGLEAREPQARTGGEPAARLRVPSTRASAGVVAVLEVVSSPLLTEALHVEGEATLGRKAENGVRGLGDRYMSGRHSRLRIEGGRLLVTDLDSKNRTFLNEQPLSPHQPEEMRVGDTLRMGTTTLRLARME